jgi:uncharacterized protein
MIAGYGENMKPVTSEQNRKFLLELARKTITKYPSHDKYLPHEIPLELQEKRGVFVTLTIGGNLRGCIGFIEPIDTIFNSVVDCAVSAAYKDPRFNPVSKSEFEKIRIELSILTKPERFVYKSVDELLKRLNSKPGIIIKKGFKSATFLPQVWEEIPSREEFLSNLCVKAGLTPIEWKTGKLDVYLYSVEHFSE